MARWRYIGYTHWWGAGTEYGNYYWSNASDGGSDLAVYGMFGIDADRIQDVPPADADITYGALDDYNGDLIALCNDYGIVREDLN